MDGWMDMVACAGVELGRTMVCFTLLCFLYSTLLCFSLYFALLCFALLYFERQHSCRRTRGTGRKLARTSAAAILAETFFTVFMKCCINNNF